MRENNFYRTIIFGCIALLPALNCARQMNPDIERGTNYQFERGYPEVRLTAFGTFDGQNNPHIDIIADIVYGSLIFKRNGDKRVANLAVELEILDVDDDNAVIQSKRFNHTQEINDQQLTESQNIFTLERQIQVKPGDYQIVFTLIDQVNNKRSTRVINTSVPNPASEESSLTNIRMLGKELGKRENNWYPITTYDAPGRLDSLKFIYNIINKNERNLTLNSKLVKFQTDTSYAKPMHRDYAVSIFSEGIDYDDRETVQTNRRLLTQKGNISVEFNFSNLPRGNYRFMVNAEKWGDETLYKARDFGIKSLNYPTLNSPEELAKPLVYLMGEGDHEELMEISDPDSLKKEIDRFWLKHIGNRSTAKSVLELYYRRVEEANKLFSNFKEGWKTDRGMVYILFGPSWYEQESHQEIEWSYTYDLSDPGLNFTFRQVKVQSEFFPFEYYFLRRHSIYYTTLNRQKQLWLSGKILERRL